VLRYLHSFAIQVSYTALANARFNIYERLSRWLLMCQDRLAMTLGYTSIPVHYARRTSIGHNRSIASL
jgi:hypothetical protein